MFPIKTVIWTIFILTLKLSFRRLPQALRRKHAWSWTEQRDSLTCSPGVSYALGFSEKTMTLLGWGNLQGVWERETNRQNGSFPVDRGISEEVKVVRSRLKWVTSLPPWAMVMSGPRLMLGSMGLMQPWSMLIPLAPYTTKGWEDRQGCIELTTPAHWLQHYEGLILPLTNCNTQEREFLHVTWAAQ